MDYSIKLKKHEIGGMKMKPRADGYEDQMERHACFLSITSLLGNDECKLERGLYQM